MMMPRPATQQSIIRLPWDGCSNLSTALLQSPPDAIEYMGSKVFQVTMTTYLGQPCPIIAPLVGRHFRKKDTKANRYGSNLAAAALPGQGHGV